MGVGRMHLRRLVKLGFYFCAYFTKRDHSANLFDGIRTILHFHVMIHSSYGGITQSGLNIIQCRAWQTGAIYSKQGTTGRSVVFSGPVRDFIVVLHQFQSPTQNFSVLYLTAILVIVHVRYSSLIGDEAEMASRRAGSRGGRLGRSPPLKPTKESFFSVILYNSANSICDIRPMFCHSKVMKYAFSLLQYRSCYETWLPNITEIGPP